MQRIAEDPTRAACPSFEDPGWGFLRQSMIAAHQGAQPLTDADAAQQMKETWARENELKIVAWNAQLERDRLEQAEQDRLAREEEDVRRAQQDREAEEQRAEAEEKKPRPNSFDAERPIDRWVEPRPSSYALGRVRAWEYVELDYFTAKGCRDAAEADRSTGHDTLALTQLGGTIAIGPLASKPSRHVRMDEDLSWEEMLDARNILLHFMNKAGTWPRAHIESIAAFFFNIEVHPRKQQKNGKKTLIVYQARARREWFDALQRKQGFNIALIHEDLLRSYADEVNDSVRDRDFEQVRFFAPLPNCVAQANCRPLSSSLFRLPQPPPPPPPPPPLPFCCLFLLSLPSTAACSPPPFVRMHWR